MMMKTSYPKYKSSGVEWLGEVPAHWEVRRLKTQVANITEQTKTLKSDDRYIALEHVESWTGKILGPCSDQSFDSHVKRFQSGDVLVGKLRPYLAKVTRPKCKGACVSEFLVLRPRLKKLSASYLERSIRSKPIIEAINASTFGAKMPRADWQFIGRMELPIPPLPEQNAIVRYLDYVERRGRRFVGAKEKLIGLLEEQKQVIIHRAVTRGLDPDVPLKPSGIAWLGEVPEHWAVARLKAHLSRNDSGVWGDDFSDEGTVVLRSTEQTMSGEWVINSPARINLSASEVAATLLKKGDLVVTKSSGSQRHIGKTSLVNDEVEKMHCCFSNFMQRLRLDKSSTPAFVWYNLNSSIGREQLVFQSTTTTGLGNLNGTILGNCWFTFPPLPEQTAIVEYLDKATANIDAAIARARREIDLLNEYRTRLIADVVTGKLDVREAAARLPDEPDEAELPDDDDAPLNSGEKPAKETKH